MPTMGCLASLSEHIMGPSAEADAINPWPILTTFATADPHARQREDSLRGNSHQRLGKNCENKCNHDTTWDVCPSLWLTNSDVDTHSKSRNFSYPLELFWFLLRRTSKIISVNVLGTFVRQQSPTRKEPDFASALMSCHRVQHQEPYLGCSQQPLSLGLGWFNRQED